MMYMQFREYQVIPGELGQIDGEKRSGVSKSITRLSFGKEKRGDYSICMEKIVR